VVFDQAENRLHAQKAASADAALQLTPRCGYPSAMLRRPWLAHYDSTVPHSLAPYPEKTLVDLLDGARHEERAPAAGLLQRRDALLSQLDDASSAFAAALADWASAAASRVALLLPNCPQFLICEFGIWKAGAIVVALNPTYSERELEQALDAMRVSVVVTLTPFYERLTAVQGRTGVRHVIATSIKEYLPPITRVLFTLFREKKDGHRIALRAGDLWLQDLLRRHRRAPAPSTRRIPMTTPSFCRVAAPPARPKGVVGPPSALRRAGLQLYEWTKSAKLPWVDVVMLPLAVVPRLRQRGVQPLAFVGPNPLSLVPNPRDIGDLLKTIAAVKPAFFNGVPRCMPPSSIIPTSAPARSTCAASSCVFPAPPRSWRRPNARSKRRPAPRSSKVFPHRSDDGVLRQSGDRAIESSARSACRCRTSTS
jgi:long-chain acyl-CoA synthetase